MRGMSEKIPVARVSDWVGDTNPAVQPLKMATGLHFLAIETREITLSRQQNKGTDQPAR